MKRLFWSVCVALTLITFMRISIAKSQTAPQTQPAAGTTPLIAGDGSVTFKLYAPNAKQVLVFGDFALKPVTMTQDARGLWSVTVGPLRPDGYSYNFRVDGVDMPDPSNTTPKSGVLWFSSQFVVPGDEADFFAVKKVPHGQLREIWYDSTALGETRRIFVYVPPGYDDNASTSYPVLYLLHGYGDDESGWINAGKANFIMDNLLAAGKATPAVIVMPFGHPSRQWVINQGMPNLDHKKRPTASERFAGSPIETELLTAVIPLIEKTFRVRTDSNSRAIAGLSMGGYQALTIGLNNQPKFAYVAGFSSALLGDNKATFAPLFANAELANSQLKLVWFGVGDKDDLLDGNLDFDHLLSTAGINHTLVVTPGYAHAWTLWRTYLRDLLPKLFRNP